MYMHGSFCCEPVNTTDLMFLFGGLFVLDRKCAPILTTFSQLEPEIHDA